MKRHIYDCQAGCPVESTLQVIAGKWKSVILYHLFTNETCRFSELQRWMPGCSRRMLALQLQELINDDIIIKKVYPVIPPKTEYRLSTFGQTLEPVIFAMEQWGQHYNLISKEKENHETPVQAH